MTLISGLKMAGRLKNATLKFFPWVFSELLYKEIWGGVGPKWMIFLKSVQNEERSPEKLKKWGVLIFPMKHRSGHKFSTRDWMTFHNANLIIQLQTHGIQGLHQDANRKQV
jgi:hypothetical protein